MNSSMIKKIGKDLFLQSSSSIEKLNIEFDNSNCFFFIDKKKFMVDTNKEKLVEIGYGISFIAIVQNQKQKEEIEEILKKITQKYGTSFEEVKLE